MIQELRHGESDQQRVFDCPDMRGVGQEAEFQREGFAVLGDIGVYAVGIGLKLRVLRRVHLSDGLLRYLAQSEDALLAIRVHEVGAKNYGEIAGSKTACHVHLPEPLLRGDVALGEKEVVEGCRGDCWDAQPITSDHHWMSESSKLNGAVFLRQRGTHCSIKPEVEGKKNDQQECQDRYDRTKQEF